MSSQMRALRRQHTSADQLRQLLQPLIKAYFLGYASSTGPRLLTLLVTLVTKKSKDGERKFERALFGVYRILRGGFEWQRFPTFCAALIGGTSLLQVRQLMVSTLVQIFVQLRFSALGLRRNENTTVEACCVKLGSVSPLKSMS